MTTPTNHRLAERRLIALVRDGQWEIDDEGRIWRVALRTGLRTGGSHVVPVDRRRAEKAVPSGYLMVRAVLDGRRVVGLAHRLIWQHVNGDIPDGMVINHLNGIKGDNRPSNLEVTSYSENTRHAVRVLGKMDQSGARNHAAKLTDAQVAEIRSLYAAGGITMVALAARYDLTFQHVSSLVRGRSRRRQCGPTVDRDLRHSVCDRDPVSGRFLRAVSR